MAFRSPIENKAESVISTLGEKKSLENLKSVGTKFRECVRKKFQAVTTITEKKIYFRLEKCARFNYKTFLQCRYNGLMS